MLIERKSAFNQNVSNLGRWWMQRPPETTFEDSAQLWKVLKGNRDLEIGKREIGIWENGIETCIISYKKWIASPGSMHQQRSI